MSSVLRSLLILVPLAFLMSGCLAVGQVFSLSGIIAALVAAGGGAIAVATLDRRESTRSGAKPPFFAGTLRGGFGNPFSVVVRGKQPLADAFTNVIANSLKAKGYDPKPVIVAHTAEEPEALQQITATGVPRSLLIEIHQWQSDTMTNVGMTYLLSAKVLDIQGNVVAQNSITGAEDGKDNLKGSVMNPAGYSKKAVPKAFQDHIERLLNHTDIVQALS
ncbi:MAG: hypothetical protein JRF63_15620 [Deltaproteobacteria bacterium]|nr:hypothetical protein [Deltaproteobacteria bacterium]